MVRIINVWHSACIIVLIFVILVTSLSTSAANTQEYQNPSSQEQKEQEQEQEQHDDDDDDELLLPNIVMIVMDDLGSHDLGLHGTGINTPNIDGLVTGNNKDNNNDDNGIYLDEYYVLPYCSPTRSALLSGMYPLQTGVHNVIRPKSTAGLPLGIETLPEMLKRTKPNPYETHAVGKWHIGHSSWKQTPTFRGFNSFFGFYIGGEDYFTHESEGGVDLHYDHKENCGEGCSQVVNERGNYSTHVFTREAINVIHNHNHNHNHASTTTTTTTANSVAGFDLNDVDDDDDGSLSQKKEIRSSSSSSLSSPTNDDTSPLFLYLAYQAVHCPNEVPAEYIEPYMNRTDWSDQRKNYAGMLSAADEGIGKVIDALKQTKLWENTLIIFTTDNGGPTTVGCIQGSSNYPKRGGKCSVWEGGTTGDALLSGPALNRLLLLSKSTSTSSSSSSLSKTSQSDRNNDDINGGDGGDGSSSSSSSNDKDHEKIETVLTSVQKNGSEEEGKEGLYTHRRFRHLFHVVDWFPTIAEWVNVIPRLQTRLDGVSQVDALSESNNNNEGLPARTELFGGYAQCLSDHSKNPSWWGPSLRHLNWKIVQGESGGPDAKDTFPPGTKQIQLPGGEDESNRINNNKNNNNISNNTKTINKTKYLLFDLEKDPSEENDISELYPEVLTKMIYKLKLYRKSFVYPQINDDSQCPFTGLINTTIAGPAWYVLVMYNVAAKVERIIIFHLCI
jgi:arylsulfatase A-like enzyme